MILSIMKYKLERIMKIPLIGRLAIGQLLALVVIYIIFFRNSQACPKLTPTFNKCQLSLLESDDFICEPDALWNERKYSYRLQEKENVIQRNTSFFFLDNWVPNFHCSNAQRIGSTGEGAKWVCDPYQLNFRHNCLVYSAETNGRFSFELGIKKAMPHCEIHTFDTASHPYPNGTGTYHKINPDNGAPLSFLKNWTTIMHDLNHTNRTIDILKMDIEGGEYALLRKVFASSKSLLPRQILVELHPSHDSDIHVFLKQLRSIGYVIFAKEQDLIAGQYWFGYSFLKLNSRFFIES